MHGLLVWRRIVWPRVMFRIITFWLFLSQLVREKIFGLEKVFTLLALLFGVTSLLLFNEYGIRSKVTSHVYILAAACPAWCQQISGFYVVHEYGRHGIYHGVPVQIACIQLRPAQRSRGSAKPRPRSLGWSSLNKSYLHGQPMVDSHNLKQCWLKS